LGLVIGKSIQFGNNKKKQAFGKSIRFGNNEKLSIFVVTETVAKKTFPQSIWEIDPIWE